MNLTSLLSNLNYGTILLLMLIESTVIPFPSEVVVAPAAYHAAAGYQNVVLVVVFATIGADLGAIINYGAAYYLRRPIIYSFARSKWGRMCMLNEEKVERSERFFDQHGVVATLTGLAKMNFWKFLLYTTIGAGAWNTILAILGWYLHSIVPEEQLNDKLIEYSDYIKIVIVALVAIAAIVFFVKKYKKN